MGGGKREDKRDYKLTRSPIPLHFAHGEGRRIENEIEPGTKQEEEGRSFTIILVSHYPVLFD